MRTKYLLLILLFSIKGFACSCDTPKPAVEFYESSYVFEGEVIKEKYASDSLTKTVTFKISKHYKNGDNPKYLDFELNSESEVTGRYSSCYWTANLGEKWLVYAKKRDGQLKFHFFCSNSEYLDESKISLTEQKVLDNGNKLELTDYRYQFFQAKPLTNVDSILKPYKNKRFDPSGFAPFWVDVNENGLLETVNLSPRRKLNYEVIDTIFGMNQFKNEYEKPRSNFERVALKIARKIKEWEKFYYLDLKESVKYRTYFKLFIDKDSIIQFEK